MFMCILIKHNMVLSISYLPPHESHLHQHVNSEQWSEQQVSISPKHPVECQSKRQTQILRTLLTPRS